MAEGGYRFLKMSARVFTVLAWLSVAIGAVVSVVLFVGGGDPETPRAAGILGLFLGGIYFFVFRTASELIGLLLEIASKIKS